LELTALHAGRSAPISLYGLVLASNSEASFELQLHCDEATVIASLDGASTALKSLSGADSEA
jgi:hypothetical protein